MADDAMAKWREPDMGPNGQWLEYCYRSEAPGVAAGVVVRVWRNDGVWWWSRTGSVGIVGPFASADQAARDEDKQGQRQ